MDKICIAGSSGFIGTSLARFLLAKGQDVVALTRSTDFPIRHPNLSVISSDYSSSEYLIAALKSCSVCVNLASPAHSKSNRNNFLYEDLFSSNQVLFNLLNACTLSNINKFVHISSAGVMGETSTVSAPFSSSSPLKPYSPYTLAKANAELMVQYFSENKSLNCIILRPPLVYANHCPGRLRTLINLIHLSPILPFGALSNFRSFVSLESLLNAISLCSVSSSLVNKTFVVADRYPVMISDLVDLLYTSIRGSLKYNIPVPRLLLSTASKILSMEQQWKSLSYDFVLDSSLLSHDTHWLPNEDTLLNLYNKFSA